ncbi:MAG: cysteine hydrolase [Verrucomicrobia bacterium]|nr:cysteine hydrolase [Verrucomicrobiota bacterium]MDA1006738.1 cysteine hydrolase [Verrucomicrobiota bacterium]
MSKQNPALLLIDFQNEFLRRPAMAPYAADVLAAVENTLRKCRSLRLPILHVHTIIAADRANRPPHWLAESPLACVEGSESAACPPGLEPLDDEPVITKQFYSGFENPLLHRELKRLAIDTLLVAGLYSHACIRSTVLDAYARGYRIPILEDAIASPEPEHARLSNEWLKRRAATFSCAQAALSTLTTAGL